MRKDFILPDIGEGIVECELVEWLVAEGDDILEDQPVAEVMTDKAVVQIPAMYSGKVEELYYKKGDIAKVHQPLFAMNLGGENLGDDQGEQANGVAVNGASVASSSSNASAQAEQVTSTEQTASSIEDFILPDIGEGIVECELVKWHISEGDMISEDQPVAEVMTDKAMVEIPAKYSGKVVKLYYQQGEIAKVHTPMYSLEVAGGVTGSNAQAPAQAKPVQACANQTAQVPANTRPGKALASPAVRRRAREMGIDIALVAGSGKKGRVMKDDLVNFQNGGVQASTASATQETPKAVTSTRGFTSGGVRKEPIRGVKAAMAKQMTESVYTIPHFSVSDEVHMDALMMTRQLLKPDFEKQDVKLTFMPFFIKAMSLALEKFPIINSQVNADCTEITYFEDHNIGMAVDSKIGLLVPNIKGVQNLSLMEVAKECNRIIEQAREGRLGQDDLRGGTISISNVGVIGGTVAVPVINKPESAIVALGKIQRLPRFDENDQVKPVNIMHISWSGDHRIIDGATMVKFNNLWKSYIENPLTMLTELR
ncbi:dihydrolipoyllysine-residue acetyltransferase [Paraneptunicella aestuarii]|uniref:dihydrolipoyllysine-residue acetyltransferase n=1 Tax=Paraneptunicella aestuarii TaxID=2831148 RepID=UPI001E420B76|nr:dihydrolipoyllysine-residue acetyltransferase [Paraneptunicella aestuarii]UAA40309.1 dihydrolipoyllysine-residue acetyltransferase [Paraneptunicella aestuarii]